MLVEALLLVVRVAPRRDADDDGHGHGPLVDEVVHQHATLNHPTAVEAEQEVRGRARLVLRGDVDPPGGNSSSQPERSSA